MKLIIMLYYRAKEQKAKLYEARLRALAGEEEQSEAESTKSERI